MCQMIRSRRMFEELMELSDRYMAKAVQANAVDLKLFYRNVSNNYRSMAYELSVEEAQNA